MKGRGDKMNILREKGVMKFGQGQNSKPALHNDKVGQG
jgi:hypothetical protein